MLANLRFQPEVPRLIVLTQVKALLKLCDDKHLDEFIGEEAYKHY